VTKLLAVSGCEREDRRADLIFVHGLNGDPCQSWSADKYPNKFWPAWLGEDMPDVGIWSLGYDANASAWQQGTTMPLTDRARNVLSCLQADRLGERPLVFITHSMGGLLTKQMLRHGRDYGDKGWRMIADATRGIVFLATPHAGSGIASWLEHVRWLIRPNRTMDELHAHEPALRDLNTWYRENAVHLGKVLVFYEKQPMHGVVVVDETSADPGIRGVLAVPVDAAHDTICKPASKEELVYKRVKEFVADCLRAAVSPAPMPAATIEKPVVRGLAPKPCREHPFIGRDDDLRRLKAGLLAGERQVLVLLPGVGKTELAVVAANDPEIQQHFRDGVLWADLGSKPDLPEQLKKWAKALGVPKEELAETKPLADWQDAVQEKIGDKRMLMVLDDVWRVEHATTFFDLGENCVRLATTRLPKVAADSALGCHKADVEELKDEDSLRLLEKLAPKAVGANPTAARDLVRTAGGLPLALVLLGNHLRIEAESGNPSQILAALEALTSAKQRLALEKAPRRPGGTPLSLAAAIDMSFEALDGEEERRTLQALAIFRPKPNAFSEEIALRVSNAQPKTIYALDKAGFLEYDKKLHRFTMHRTIAEYAREKLDPETTKQLHRRAFDYYQECSKKYDENPHYEGWYRYENPEWQALNDDRLYHLAHTGDEAAAMLEFVRTYSDAFWWWGCFLEFSLCDELLKEWRQKDISLRGSEGIDLLRQFQKAYPKETEERSTGDWMLVEASLARLLKIIELDGNAAGFADRQQRHIRGLCDIFLAEACRFGSADRARAAQWYQEADELFLMNNDNWARAWVLFHSADNNCERDELPQALEQCRLALTLGESEHDPELIALVYRVQGDIHLKQHDIDQAAHNYARASFHAYRFQVDPAVPDPYTVTFYSQMVERVLGRLCAAEQLQATQLAIALHQFWMPNWTLSGAGMDAPNVAMLLAADRLEQLSDHLFPPKLAAADIKERGSSYGDQVKSVLAKMDIPAA